MPKRVVTERDRPASPGRPRLAFAAVAVAALATPLSGGVAQGNPDLSRAQTPSRGVIAYAVDGQIRVVRLDGTGARTITNGRSPAWSFDGRVMAFESESPDVPLNGTDIYLVNADGSDRRRVVTHSSTSDDTGDDREPAWAPDNYRIAFTTSRTGNYEIWLTNAIGHATGQVTISPAADHSPTWSPDGNALAFVSNRDGNDEVYVHGFDGTSERRLTHDSAADAAPAWSPDGRRIAFASNRGGNFDIYVMNTDGSGVVRLTSDPGTDTNPAWSLDGQSIVYTSGHPPSSWLYMVPANGGAAQPLPDATRSADDGVWQPSVDLSIGVRAASVVRRIRSASVTLEARNTGPIAADGVVVASRASGDARLARFQAPGARCTRGRRELSCTFTRLSVGAVASVRATWRATRCGAFALRASLGSWQSDLDASDNTARRTVRVPC